VEAAVSNSDSLDAARLGQRLIRCRLAFVGDGTSPGFSRPGFAGPRHPTCGPVHSLLDAGVQAPDRRVRLCASVLTGVELLAPLLASVCSRLYCSPAAEQHRRRVPTHSGPSRFAYEGCQVSLHRPEVRPGAGGSSSSRPCENAAPGPVVAAKLRHPVGLRPYRSAKARLAFDAFVDGV
jgi:hypothetical protein